MADTENDRSGSVLHLGWSYLVLKFFYIPHKEDVKTLGLFSQVSSPENTVSVVVSAYWNPVLSVRGDSEPPLRVGVWKREYLGVWFIKSKHEILLHGPILTWQTQVQSSMGGGITYTWAIIYYYADLHTSRDRLCHATHPTQVNCVLLLSPPLQTSLRKNNENFYLVETVKPQDFKPSVLWERQEVTRDVSFLTKYSGLYQGESS